MPSGGGSSGTQTVTQRSDPWDQQKPFLLEGFDKAKTWLNSNQPELYPLSRVTPWTKLQGRTMQDIVNRADAGSDILRSGQQAVRDISSGGISGLQSTIGGGFLGRDPSATNLGAYAGGDFSGTGQGQTLSNASAGNFGNLAGGSTLGATSGGGYLASNPVNMLLGRQATGQFLGGNPYNDQMFDSAARGLTRNFAEGVMPSVDAGYARAGRFGSGLHGNSAERAYGELGRSLGDLGANIYGQDYARERQAMDSAANTIGNQYANERGMQQNAAQTLLGQQTGAAQNLIGNQLASNQQVQGAYDNERNRMMQAAIADNQARLQAAGMAPEMANADYADLYQKMNIGAMNQGMNEARLQDDLARWDFMQNKDINKLGQYMGMIGGGYGSTQTTQQPIYNNRAAGLLGGALGIGALGNMFGFPMAGVGSGLMNMFSG